MNHFSKGEPIFFTIPGNIPGVSRQHRSLHKGGGGGGTDGAEVARQNREAAEAKVARQQQIVDSAFGDAFNDDFYNSRQQAYLDYYKPEFDRQQQTARDKTVTSLASRGLLASSQGAKEEGDFSKSADDAWQAILKGANDYVTNLKSGVSASKQALLQGAGAFTDQGLRDQAVSAVQLRSQAPTFGPVGQLFSNLATPVVMANAGGSDATAMGGVSTQNPGVKLPYGQGSSSLKTVS